MVRVKKLNEVITGGVVHLKSHALSQRSFPHHQKGLPEQSTYLACEGERVCVRANKSVYPTGHVISTTFNCLPSLLFISICLPLSFNADFPS
jgi:hypothetical protein